MSVRRHRQPWRFLHVLAILVVTSSGGVAEAATPQAHLTITVQPVPSYFSDTHPNDYEIIVTNTGGAATDGSTITVGDSMPAGLTVTSVSGVEWAREAPLECTEAPLECKYNKPLAPDHVLQMTVEVAVTGAAGQVIDSAEVSGGGTALESAAATTTISQATPPFAFENFAFGAAGLDGSGEDQAGGHPYEVTAAFALKSRTEHGTGSDSAGEEPKDIVLYLPAGFLGDPQATPHCALNLLEDTEEDFNPESPTDGQTLPKCPSGSRVGVVTLALGAVLGVDSGSLRSGSDTTSLYNVTPEGGHPAELGFRVLNNMIVMYPELVRTVNGYRLRVDIPGVPEALDLFGASVTLFGEPGSRDGEQVATTGFITNPTRCQDEPTTATIEADSWEAPSRWIKDESVVYPELTGCNRLSYEPTITVSPEATQADTPSGYEIDISTPNAASGWPSLSSPELKGATISLPPGLSVSPAAAAGLESCQEKGARGLDVPNGMTHADEAGEGEEIGPDGLSRLTAGHCPAGASVGTVEVETPLLPPHTVTGHLYLAEPKCGAEGQPECTEASATNGELYSLYLEAEGKSEGHSDGVIVKLKGSVAANPATGQLTATFDENPQFPFSELRVHLKGGPLAPLANPQQCGSFEAGADLVPWSAPITPDATPGSRFTIDGCSSPTPFSPSFSAGTVVPIAGGSSPFTLTLSREDGQQDISGITTTLPAGLVGDIAEVPLCGEPQAASGQCPEASKIGTTTVAAGAGSQPLWLSGNVYLTGPFGGAPFGLSVVVPAKSGPFNLGNVMVRATISINPATSAVTVTSGPIPQSRDGVPFRLRTVNVTINRPGFMQEPTNCGVQTIDGTVSSAQGATARVSSRFAVTGCANLPFKPAFTVATQNNASKANGASLNVKISYPAGGEANIKSVKADLPVALPSRDTTLQKACVATVFERDPAACPSGSIVGHGKAVTPVLPVPLTGPAYLVSHAAEAFPSMVVVLQGDGVTVQLTGQTDIKKGITSSDFTSVPDVPVSSFELALPEGPDSLLTAYGELCKKALPMPTKIVGQNGAEVAQTTKILVTGCPDTLSVSHSVTKRTIALKVAVPAGGKLIATAAGLSKATKSTTGRESVTLRLTASARERHTYKIKLLFKPTTGKILRKALEVQA